MSKGLTFFTNPQSRGRVARWMLEEVGAAYQTELLQYGEEMKSERYLSINPMGKVPALLHGNVVVTETAAICAYLADAFPDAKLAPEPAERGAYYRWLFFGAGPLEAAISNNHMGFEVPPEREAMMGYGRYDTVMDVLESELGKEDYIAGERFTAADVYLGSHIGWGLQFGTVERCNAFVEYWARLEGREALKRANKIDDALAAENGLGR